MKRITTEHLRFEHATRTYQNELKTHEILTSMKTYHKLVDIPKLSKAYAKRATEHTNIHQKTSFHLLKIWHTPKTYLKHVNV